MICSGCENEIYHHVMCPVCDLRQKFDISLNEYYDYLFAKMSISKDHDVIEFLLFEMKKVNTVLSLSSH